LVTVAAIIRTATRQAVPWVREANQAIAAGITRHDKETGEAAFGEKPGGSRPTDMSAVGGARYALSYSNHLSALRVMK
jgi:hypothetical protein